MRHIAGATIIHRVIVDWIVFNLIQSYYCFGRNPLEMERERERERGKGVLSEWKLINSKDSIFKNVEHIWNQCHQTELFPNKSASITLYFY